MFLVETINQTMTGGPGEHKVSAENKDHLLSGERIEELKKTARKVGVSYKICSLHDVDSVACTFEVDVKLAYQWQDPLLVGMKKGAVDITTIKGAFDPELEISNEYELTVLSNATKLTDPKNGTVKRSIRYKGSLSMVDTDLSMFPFDAHNLPLCIRPHRLAIENLLLIPIREDSTLDAHPQNEWNILSHCMKEYVTDPSTSSTGKTYSSLHIVMLVKREGAWFVNNILTICCGLVIVALTAYSMEPESQQDRNDVAVLTMLAAITNKFVVSEHLPKIPYRTLVDLYLDICFMMHILVILSNVVCLVFKEHEDWGWFGDNLNLILFNVMLTIYGTFHIWLFFVIREHEFDVMEWKEESDMTGKGEQRTNRSTHFENSHMTMQQSVMTSPVESSFRNTTTNGPPVVSIAEENYQPPAVNVSASIGSSNTNNNP